ncbi:MBL fold metallo-hydrolase [Acrocarpospora phusangensis]|uniref:MBL fold metallo-hydrolase n=1 Tax=Acrocarpospora phusangensis TaxID=1070424 RepID=A0A919QCT8_9ACTN|nr:MBL fold metallo-hydrolase [Acrocarpospora phusangensis]GIH25611.1 MBL fold metallo-hydrolase [Acrocarpospora phusangensis]
MRLLLLGVRGSTPAPGPEYVRYGGHTSCVAVLPAGDNGDGAPALVLDAGTGIRQLAGPFRGAILLSHLHWDHVQGLPFSRAVDHPDSRAELVVPVVPGADPLATLTGQMSPPHFPIEPGGLLGDWTFTRPAPVRELAGMTVRQAEVTHKGGVTVGTRIERDGTSVVYLPDHAPQLGSAAAEELAAGADLLIHDGQFRPEEQALADAYGHATITDALDFAARCGVRRLLLTHHAPGRTDDQLDAMAKEWPDVEFARQGETVTPSDRSRSRTR